MVKYVYDAWGNHKIYLTDGTEIYDNHTGIVAGYEDHIGNVNPLRYRSYNFDSDINLYYLKSRYYDPETGRFISPDSIDYLDPDSINGLNYAGTQLLNGNNITLGGLIVNAGIGALCGWIGQSGWMQGQTTSAFVAFAGKNALKHVIGMVGTETLLRMTLPAFILGGVGGGIYGRLSSYFNSNGNFIGI